MFAVVRTGGKQYRVAAGDKIVVEKLDGAAGDRIELADVMLAGEGAELRSTDGLTVAAEIIAQAKSDKVTVFKKRRRHNYRRKRGHRQQLTILRIIAIGDDKAKKPAKQDAKAQDAKSADDKSADRPGSAAPAPAETKSAGPAQPVAQAPAAEARAAKPAKAATPAKAAADDESTATNAAAKGAAKSGGAKASTAKASTAKPSTAKPSTKAKK